MKADYCLASTVTNVKSSSMSASMENCSRNPVPKVNSSTASEIVLADRKLVRKLDLDLLENRFRPVSLDVLFVTDIHLFVTDWITFI